MLQPCPVVLLDRTAETESCKDQLRQQFLELSATIAAQLQQMGYLVTRFDPRTGLPIDCRPGELRLDDVAVVRSLLGYSIEDHGGCATILHPSWGRAVYPSVLLSSASPEVVERVMRAIDQPQRQWQTTPLSAGV
jgi:Methylmalonic aciduria and homocystinuria type D protein